MSMKFIDMSTMACKLLCQQIKNQNCQELAESKFQNLYNKIRLEESYSVYKKQEAHRPNRLPEYYEVLVLKIKMFSSIQWCKIVITGSKLSKTQ